MSPDHTPTALSVKGIRKAFGPTVAVDDVSFDIHPGSVHALLGENGAGKSTLVKRLSGLMLPDSGSIEVEGRSVTLGSPRASHRCGIQTAFQEMTLIRDLSVLDNMMLPYAPLGVTGMIRRRSARAAIDRHLEEAGFPVSYTNVFWGGRSEIKPSEISPFVYKNWHANHSI